MHTPSTYFILGGAVHFTLWLTYKQLRKRRFMVVAIVTSILLAIAGFYMQGIDRLQMKNGYAANWLFTPAFFLITYTIFRYLFKLIFKNEPIMAGYMQMSWDQGEYRRLHLGDSLFTVITLIFPMLIPLWL